MDGRRRFVAVFLVALAVRAALLLALGPGRPLADDERGYAAVAGSLARGEGFGFTVQGTDLEGLPFERRLAAFRAPLLPAVLAPVHAASGGSPAALRWACVLLGALAAPLAVSLARRAGSPEGPAMVAGALVAAWPAHAWLSGQVLSEGLDAALLLAAADLVLARRPASAGATLGLAVLCRPGGIPAAMLLAVAAAAVADRGRRARAAVLCVGVAAAVVLPWVIRNGVVLGRPVLVTSTGVTLLGGNCDAALAAPHPGKWVPPERAWSGPGRPDAGMYGWSALDEGASDARFRARAAAWVAESPGAAARLAAWKVVRFLDPDTRSEKADAGRKALAGWLSWGPALLLGVAALGGVGGVPWGVRGVALALLLGHLAAAVVAYGDARARAPVEPALLALLVAPVLASGVAKWTGRRAGATLGS